jgi:hypothetical protein
MLTESSGETLNRFVARRDKAKLDGAFRARSREPRTILLVSEIETKNEGWWTRRESNP